MRLADSGRHAMRYFTASTAMGEPALCLLTINDHQVPLSNQERAAIAAQLAPLEGVASVVVLPHLAAVWFAPGSRADPGSVVAAVEACYRQVPLQVAAGVGLGFAGASVRVKATPLRVAVLTCIFSADLCTMEVQGPGLELGQWAASVDIASQTPAQVYGHINRITTDVSGRGDDAEPVVVPRLHFCSQA